MQDSTDKMFDKFFAVIKQHSRECTHIACPTMFSILHIPIYGIADRVLTGVFQIPLVVNLNTQSKKLVPL